MIEQPVDEDTLSECNSGKSSRSNSMVEQSYHHGELDQLTLELLMNKNHYHKYMSAANPDKFAKREAYLADLKKYRQKILNITHELLDRPDTQITTDIANIFEAYTKTIIEHVKHSASRCDADVEPFDDTLFGTIDETDNQDRNDPPPSQSFWGKERVVRRGHNQTQLQYDLNVFSRSTR
jgi:hypothetical protein